jgi:hypothetical protein
MMTPDHDPEFVMFLFWAPARVAAPESTNAHTKIQFDRFQGFIGDSDFITD